jgi:hypothetical protein
LGTKSSNIKHASHVLTPPLDLPLSITAESADWGGK